MFKNLRLKYRILLGYSVPLLLAVVVAIVVYNCVLTVKYKESEVDRANTIIHEMLELELSFTRTVNSTRGILLLQDEVSKKNHQKAVKEVGKKIELVKNLLTDPRNKETLVKLDNIQKKLIKFEGEVFSYVNEGKLDKGLELFKTEVGPNLFNDSVGIIDDFLEKQLEKVQIRKKASLQASDTLLKVLIGGTLLMVILAVAIGLWIAARTSKAINEAATSISTSATEIATTVSQHERAASEQFAMVNETTATVEELNASARQSAEQASSSVEAAQRTSALTEEGNQAVVQAIEGVNSLKDKMEVVADQILRLGKQTSQIDNIAGLVKDLATQTNMLALNAAVEAARAGEHGKGFAVVASEVRKLADQSKKSAEETSIIIADIQKSTNATIMETEESTKTVEEVTKSAHRVEELFETLAGEAGRVYENAQQGVLNAKQQSTALSQIGEAMNNINASSKETTTGISQTKIGIQDLENAAHNLQAMV